MANENVDRKSSEGIPTIQVTSEEVRHPDGRVDVKVKVPVVKLQQALATHRKKVKELKEKENA